MKISMGGKGRSRENVFVEQLWRTVKCEEMCLKAYSSATKARRKPGTSFRFFNNQRAHHPSLGYRTPAEVFHGAINTPTKALIVRNISPEQALISLAGTACPSLNSTQILSK